MYNSSNVQVGNTETIEIVKGTESGINGNKITITNKSRVVNMNLTTNGMTLENIENLPALSTTFDHY